MQSQNILVFQIGLKLVGSMHLSDFGVAKKYSSAQDMDSTAKEMAGTPGFIAPEMFGSSPFNPFLADGMSTLCFWNENVLNYLVFSFGMVMLELFTGQH